MSLLYKITCDGYTLLDQTVYGGDYDMTEATLDLEINDGIFEGRLDFTVPMYHPHLDKIRPMASIILVTEIYNGEQKERFRGRPVLVRPEFGYLCKVSCESDIKFLADIPDVFSARTKDSSTIYKIGSEKTMQKETMTRIPTGSVRPGKPTYEVDPETGARKTIYGEDQISRFNENRTYVYDPDTSIDGDEVPMTVYRSEVIDTGDLNVVGKRVGLSPYAKGNTRYSNYLFQAVDVGKLFTVDWKGPAGNTVTYQLPLKTCGYTTTIYEGQTAEEQDYTKKSRVVHGLARYLGNIGIIAANKPEWDIPEFDPYEQVSVIGGDSTRVDQLDFCIVQYGTSCGWMIQEISEGVFQILWTPMSETVIYTYANRNVDYVWLKAYRNGGTTVRAMATSIFGRDGEPATAQTVQDMNSSVNYRFVYEGDNVSYRKDDLYKWENNAWTKQNGYDPTTETLKEIQTPQEMQETTDPNDPTRPIVYGYKGPDEIYFQDHIYVFNGYRWIEETINYNSFVPSEKKIFLGLTEIDTELENSSVSSCYDNLRTWLSETGGYAKIQKSDGFYYIDLTEDSGEYSDDFYVKYGANVLDASEEISCSGLFTGIYVQGTMKEDSSSDDSQTQEGQGAEYTAGGRTDDDSEPTPVANDPNYELSFRKLRTKEATLMTDMTDTTVSYLYVGKYIRFHAANEAGRFTGKYTYDHDPNVKAWVQYYGTDTADYIVDTPSSMTYIGSASNPVIYEYTGPDLAYKPRHTYRYDNNAHWVEDSDVVEPVLDDGFEMDAELGVIWNTEARARYGEIVKYLEVDVSDVQANQRMQRMADEGVKELRKDLLALMSFDISASDPRVVGLDGKTPELGNYYPIDIPWLALNHEYHRLSKLSINILDQKNIKLSLGNKAPLLSDFVAEKGTRL